MVVRRVGIALSLRPLTTRCGLDRVVHLLRADLIHRGVDVLADTTATAPFECGGGRGRHHIGNDDIAVGDRTRNDGATIGPPSEISATRECRAGAVYAPFVGERAGLTEYAAGNHDE